MRAPRPTLRSLAAEAGVSAMTVSLALRNRPEVSAATRRRIQRLAAARGYRPDPEVARLMQHLRTRGPLRYQAGIAALMQAWPREILATSPYAAGLRAGLEERAEALGYGFDLLHIDDYPSGRRLEQVLLSRGVRGLVVMPLRTPGSLDGLLDWSRFSVVSVASSLISPRFHGVSPSHFDNMLRACRELTATGHRRIGLAIPRQWATRVLHRWTGGIAWQNEHGGTEPVVPYLGDEPGLRLDARRLARWLRDQRPDAVVAEQWDDALVAEVITPLPRRARPTLVTMNWPTPGADAGIDQQPREIGRVAADLLTGMITRNERGVPPRPHGTLVDGVWVAGESGLAHHPVHRRA